MDEQERVVLALRDIVAEGPHDPPERLNACLRALVPKDGAKALAQLADCQELLFSGPAYYQLAYALQPWAGDSAQALVAAWAGILKHYAWHSPSPWAREAILKHLLAVAGAFRN